MKTEQDVSQKHTTESIPTGGLLDSSRHSMVLIAGYRESQS